MAVSMSLTGKLFFEPVNKIGIKPALFHVPKQLRNLLVSATALVHPQTPQVFFEDLLPPCSLLPVSDGKLPPDPTCQPENEKQKKVTTYTKQVTFFNESIYSNTGCFCNAEFILMNRCSAQLCMRVNKLRI